MSKCPPLIPTHPIHAHQPINLTIICNYKSLIYKMPIVARPHKGPLKLNIQVSYVNYHLKMIGHQPQILLLQALFM
jgi:hypothetical protein